MASNNSLSSGHPDVPDPNFPEHYVYDKKKRATPGSTKGDRMFQSSPSQGERFYLRLLLAVRTGPTSFEDLQTLVVDLVSFSEFRVRLRLRQVPGGRP